jgi:hypothetical protein
MPRKVGDECTFRQRDLQVALKAARNALGENFEVRVDKAGVITVVKTTPGEAEAQRGTLWDKLLDGDEK